MRTSSLITFACVFRSFRSSAICNAEHAHQFQSTSFAVYTVFCIIDGVDRNNVLVSA